MPVQYSSILNEHAAERNQVGVFDISHMGQVFVTGENQEAWLNHLLSNNLSKLQPGEGQYTMMLNEKGGVIDDLIAYRISEQETLLVINASMIPEDVAWMESHLQDGVTQRIRLMGGPCGAGTGIRHRIQNAFSRRGVATEKRHFQNRRRPPCLPDRLHR
jgi:glycine cleavage system aminomethyltransferase T